MTNYKGPFQPTAPSNVPVIGQPFQLLSASIPVTATLRCNCGGGDGVIVEIFDGTPTACGSCGRRYTPIFNLTNGQLQVQIEVPQQETPQ